MGKGLFSFMLVALFMELQLVVLSVHGIASQKSGDAAVLALQQEIAGFVRSEIEENLDLLIMETLSTELKAKQLEPEAIRERIVTRAMQLFTAFEEAYKGRPSVKFYSSRIQGGSAIPPHGKRMDSETMSQASSVLVLGLGGKLFLAQFDYNGGIMRNESAYALIELGKCTQLFMLPPGYSVRTVGMVI